MAVVITPASPQGVSMRKWNIAADADADTTATIAHGFGVIPFNVSLIPLSAAARISNWILTSVDATNIVLTKTTTSGSGAAPVQATVIASLPHSLVA